MTIQSVKPDSSSPVQALIQAWGSWRKRRARRAELAACSQDELQRMASDAGMSVAELRALADKDENSAQLLALRMDALRLNTVDIERRQPKVMQDLQRLCSLCGAKHQCEHDLKDNPADPSWRAYCPNADTLGALEAESSPPAKGK